MGGGMRARSNDRHFATKNIDQLRKLIDVRATQECADSRNPVIISHCLYELPAVIALRHGAKLKHFDGLVVVTVPRLTKQNGTARVQLDGKRHDQEQWRKDYEACGGDD